MSDANRLVPSNTISRAGAQLVLPLATTYAIAGWVGLALAIPPGYATPVFPAAGLALACVLWFGPSALPGVWLGSALLNLSLPWMSGTLTPSTTIVAMVIATGATLQAWTGSWLVRRRQGPAWQTLEQEQEVLAFLLLGGMLPGVISSAHGVTALHALGIIERADLLFTAWTWYVGDVLGVLVFAPLTLCVLSRDGGLWRDRRRRIVIPMLLTLGLVAMAFYGTARWERQAQDIQLEADSKIVFNRIADRVIAHREVLSSLKHFIEATPDFSFNQFEMFTRITLQDNPDIFALSFNDLITDAQRPTFEGVMSRVSPLGSFQITERNAAGKLIRAVTRPEYVTVRHIVPLANNQAAVGYDIYSEPVRREAINRARASGAMAVTAPVRLVQEQRQRVGVLELLPVTRVTPVRGHDQAARLLGFAVAVVKVDEMIEIATKARVPAGLVFQLIDRHAPPGQGLLYHSERFTADSIPLARATAWKTALRMGDREWELSVHPTQEYRRHHRPWMAWAVGAVGLLLASLLQILMLGMTGRAFVQARTEERLTHSHDLMRYIIEHNNSAVAVHDRDLRYLYVSQRYLEQYKVEERDVIGKHHYDVFPDLPQKWRDVHQRALRGEIASADRDPYPRADGTTDWTRWECRPWYEANGAIGGIIVYTEVITERVRDDEALRQANLVVENSPVVLFRWRAAEGWPVAMVTRNVSQFGYSPDELLSGAVPFAALVHPDDRDRIAREVQEYSESGTDRFRQEYRIVTKNGGVRWVDDRTVVERNVDGLILFYQGIVIDITDRKKAEEALRESEARFRGLFIQSSVGMVQANAQGRLLEVNPAFAALLDRPVAFLEGKPVEDFTPPEDWPREQETVRGALTRGESTFRLEKRYRRPDGSTVWADVSFFTVRPNDSGPRMLFGMAVDITERKQAEEALRASLAEKDSLLREVHHRVKNNLQVISSLLSLQLRQVGNAEVRSFLRDTQNRIRSMAMLHEILYHSHTIASISFPAYVKSLCGHLARSYGSAARNIRVTQRVADVTLNLDQAITAGLIVNELVTNAMKHAFPSRSDGEIVVELQAHDERRLALRVSDNGVGLPVGASPDGPKTLGLLLVSRLSRQLDGHLSVKSEPGAVFEIVFPRKPTEG